MHVCVCVCVCVCKIVLVVTKLTAQPTLPDLHVPHAQEWPSKMQLHRCATSCKYTHVCSNGLLLYWQMRFGQNT